MHFVLVTRHPPSCTSRIANTDSDDPSSWFIIGVLTHKTRTRAGGVEPRTWPLLSIQSLPLPTESLQKRLLGDSAELGRAKGQFDNKNSGNELLHLCSDDSDPMRC